MNPLALAAIAVGAFVAGVCVGVLAMAGLVAASRRPPEP